MVRIDIVLPVATFFAIMGGLALMSSNSNIGLLMLRAGMFAAGINIFVSLFYAALAYE